MSGNKYSLVQAMDLTHTGQPWSTLLPLHAFVLYHCLRADLLLGSNAKLIFEQICVRR